MKLLKLGNARYRVLDGNISVEGDRAQCVAYMTENGVLGREILVGLEVMQAKGHNEAEFGVNGTFMYTLQSEPEPTLLEQLQMIQELRQQFHSEYIRSGKSDAANEQFHALYNAYVQLDVEALIKALTELGVKAA